MDSALGSLREQCVRAEKAVEAYMKRLASMREALQQRIKSESEKCEQAKQRLAEVEVEHKQRKDACLRSKEQLEATQQEMQRWVKDLENLSIRDSVAVDALKEFDKKAYDDNIKVLSKQKRLVSKIMKLELEQCSETGDLKGAFLQDDGKLEPFHMTTSGRDQCDVADDLWNLVPD